MSRDHERRLRRLEAAGGKSMPLAGTAIVAHSREEAERQLQEAIAAGTYQPGWPLIIVTGTPVSKAKEIRR